MATTPDVIQAWAASEQAVLASVATALSNLSTGIAALDALITNLQNSPGPLGPGDQPALDAIVAASNALLAQAQAISTTPPGTAVPVVPPAAKKK
jgi:hypothetical protein